MTFLKNAKWNSEQIILNDIRILQIKQMIYPDD